MSAARMESGHDLHGGGAVLFLGGSEPVLIPGPGRSKERLEPARWTRCGAWRVQVRPRLDLESVTGHGPRPVQLSPRLVIRTPDGIVREVALPTGDGESFVIGRARQGNHVTLNDRHVSKQHLRIVSCDGELEVEDLRSRHGTKLNRAPLSVRTRLVHRDEIVAGATHMEFLDYGAALRTGQASGREVADVEVASGENTAESPAPLWVSHQEPTVGATVVPAGSVRSPANPRVKLGRLLLVLVAGILVFSIALSLYLAG